MEAESRHIVAKAAEAAQRNSEEQRLCEKRKAIAARSAEEAERHATLQQERSVAEGKREEKLTDPQSAAEHIKKLRRTENEEEVSRQRFTWLLRGR